MSKEKIDKSKKQLRELKATLIVQFVLGVLLITVIEFEPDKSSKMQSAILIAHSVLATYILIIAIIRLVGAYKLKDLITKSWLGLVSIIIAYASGSVSAQTGDSWATLVMSLGFIFAFIFYL